MVSTSDALPLLRPPVLPDSAELVRRRTRPARSLRARGAAWALNTSIAVLPALQEILRVFGLVGPGALSACAAFCASLWASTLRQLDLAGMTDLGLVSVIPPTALFSFVPLLVGFPLALCVLRPRAWLLSSLLVTLVCMLYGASSFAEDVPRMSVNWRHVGIIDFVSRHRDVDPTLDAFFNWPGFFILGAFLTEAAGLDSAAPLIPWVPVVVNLLYLLPLAVLLRSITSDPRAVWLGLWLFALCNWIGQDYLAPQALAYFGYLAVVALLFTGFRVAPPSPNPRSRLWLTLGRLTPPTFSGLLLKLSVFDRFAASQAPVAALRPTQRAGILVLTVAILAYLVSSHQLTPFFALAVIGVLTTLRRLSAPALPLILATMIGGWVCFMAPAFLSGHIGTIVGVLGRVDSVVTESVGERVTGSPEHLLVVRIRLAMTFAIWLFALGGALRRLRHGCVDLLPLVVACVPAGLLALQSYGGEMALRVYLFTLPGMVALAAFLFFPSPALRVGPRSVALLTLMGCVLASGQFVSRYGNERMDYYTREEVAAVDHIYRVAPPGSVLAAAGWSVPWKHRDYETHVYFTLEPHTERERELIETADAILLAARLRAENWKDGDAFFLITRAQLAQFELYGFGSEIVERFVQELRLSGLFSIEFENPHAIVFRLNDDSLLP